MLKQDNSKGRGYSRKPTAYSTKTPPTLPPNTTMKNDNMNKKNMKNKTTAPDCSSRPPNTATASPQYSTTSSTAYAQVGRLMTTCLTTPWGSVKIVPTHGLRGANPHRRLLHEEEEHREEEEGEEQHPQEPMLAPMEHQRREGEQETLVMTSKIGTLHVYLTVDEAVGYIWRTDVER
jgi:hypothetical protein